MWQCLHRRDGPPGDTKMARSDSIGMLPVKADAAVIVAHPDDEVLWSGGLILSRPQWRWRIVTLCRASDIDRASRFHRVLGLLGAEGGMADLDDGPDQTPLDAETTRLAVTGLLQGAHFDLIVTHGPRGEYTRHRRHEECCRAVVGLWGDGRIDSGQLWLFAYEDGGGAFPPRVSGDASVRLALNEGAWREKHDLITGPYGFGSDSWEARCTPRDEGFSIFDSPREAASFVESNTMPP